METIIRRGGKQTPNGFVFELSGGDLSLDFVNTVDMRPTDHAKELLPDARELYSWARQAGMLSRKQEQALQQTAAGKPAPAEVIRRKAIRLRECLYLVFKHVADGAPIPPKLAAEWNECVRACMDHYELSQVGPGMTWRLRSDVSEPDSLLWPIVHAAVQLLTGPQVSRIRRCASESCDWMFLDTSKRGNRRWCDMTVCGNRAKARRFYQRSRQSKTRQSA